MSTAPGEWSLSQKRKTMEEACESEKFDLDLDDMSDDGSVETRSRTAWGQSCQRQV